MNPQRTPGRVVSTIIGAETAFAKFVASVAAKSSLHRTVSFFFFFRTSADSRFQTTTVTWENVGFKGSDGGRVCAQHIRISWLLFLYTTIESKGPPAVSVYRHHCHREPREPLVVFRLFLVVRVGFGLAVDCSLSVSCILLIHNICGPKPGWALCYSCALRNDRMFLLRYTRLRTTCTVHST
jgi:hypothetical protein